jgi:hypothetical protein
MSDYRGRQPLDHKPTFDWGVSLILAGLMIAALAAGIVWFFYSPT